MRKKNEGATTFHEEKNEGANAFFWRKNDGKDFFYQNSQTVFVVIDAFLSNARCRMFCILRYCPVYYYPSLRIVIKPFLYRQADRQRDKQTVS